MQISLAYVLIAAEIMLLLFGVSITLGIILLRKPSSETDNIEPAEEMVETSDEAESELDAIDLGETYIDFLEQAIDRNEHKKNQQENVENTPDNDEKEDVNDEISSPPDGDQSQLLSFREQFLLIEKSAAESSEHEIHFWNNIYDGMKNLLEQFSSEHIVSSESSPDTVDNSSEKIFYIETQGKKIDGEVNKLKDIIYEQENALSSMKKAMASAEEEHPEESESLNALKEQIEAIERQLNDSKMCMEVLEMENNRLQEEVDKIDTLNLAGNNDTQNAEIDNDSVIDLEEMKGMVEEQKNKIKELITTIESLEISADDTEKLKGTINDFTRTSQEMMGCIAILEEENERLKADEETAENDVTEAIDDGEETSTSDNTENLQNTINSLEEEVIKKDVAYAQLQDEFSSMETEYLAMYEAMHGDNS